VTFVAIGIAEKHILRFLFTARFYVFNSFYFFATFLFKEKRWKNGMRIL